MFQSWRDSRSLTSCRRPAIQEASTCLLEVFGWGTPKGEKNSAQKKVTQSSVTLFPGSRLLFCFGQSHSSSLRNTGREVVGTILQIEESTEHLEIVMHRLCGYDAWIGCDFDSLRCSMKYTSSVFEEKEGVLLSLVCEEQEGVLCLLSLHN